MPKRNLDRMRELLLLAEQFEQPLLEYEDTGLIDMDEVMNCHSDILSPDDDYQLWLMDRTGWIEVPKDWVRIFRITPSGHDYLDAVRDDTIWNKTKSGAAQVGGMTVGMMKDLAISYIKKEAAEKLGVVL